MSVMDFFVFLEARLVKWPRKDLALPPDFPFYFNLWEYTITCALTAFAFALAARMFAASIMMATTCQGILTALVSYRGVYFLLLIQLTTHTVFAKLKLH